MTPNELLRQHVTGAIERGEGVAIVVQPAPHVKRFRVRYSCVHDLHNVGRCIVHAANEAEAIMKFDERNSAEGWQALSAREI